MSFDPDIHVPGAWRCAKCGFRLQQMNLNAQDGTVTSRDQAGDVCPNDGAPLWRVTWKDDAAEAFDQIQALIDENARLREANGILEDALQEVGDDYPGSSCQQWCQHQVKAARSALSPNPDQQED